MDKPVILIAGAGGLAYSLARALRHKRLEVKAILSRNPELAAQRLDIPGQRVLSYSEKNLKADLLILAVPDTRIVETARKVCEGNEISCVVHCSGSANLSVLKDLAEDTGVMYPLQTFTPGREVSLDKVPLFWEASTAQAAEKLKHLAEILSEKAIPLDSEQRAILHTGAVFANNFNNFLAFIAHRFADKAGQKGDIYQPILEETLAKLRILPPEKAQTGPARRKDQETMEKHLELLKKHFPEWTDLYSIFSKRISEQY
jgi:predicted short-subunit dehydrogenase-like oxidoreductase (DUF2520 family)